MILVDSSVWVSFFRRHHTQATARLATFLAADSILVGDIILLEILRGARDDAHAARIETQMRRFEIVPLLDERLAIHAAQHYRRLRALGITIRKSPDLIIGTYCIANKHALLHNDRDFDPMATHLGLKIA